MKQGSPNWHKKSSQKNTSSGPIFNKPKEWFDTFKHGSEDEKKELMKKLFMGFAALFLIKLLLGGLGGGRQQNNPYDPYNQS